MTRIFSTLLSSEDVWVGGEVGEGGGGGMKVRQYFSLLPYPLGKTYCSAQWVKMEMTTVVEIHSEADEIR